MTALSPDPTRSLFALGDMHFNAVGVTTTFRLEANERAQKCWDRASVIGAAATLMIGDITEEGRPEEATIAHAWWATVPSPKVIVPGNHDVESGFDLIADWEGRYGSRFSSIETDRFRLVGAPWKSLSGGDGLDTANGKATIAALLAGTNKPTILAFHYPPRDTVPNTGTPYNFAIGVGATANLQSLIGTYPNLQLILTGHTHTEPWFTAPGTITGTPGGACLHHNLGATTYQGSLGNTKSPLIAYFFTFYDTFMEVRLRDAHAGAWVPRSNGAARVETWNYL